MKYTKEVLEPVVKESRSFRDVVIRLGKKPHGGSIDHIKSKIKEFGIDTTHFLAQTWNIINLADTNKKTADELLIKGTTVRGSMLRRALIEIGVPYQCKICTTTHWQGKELNLEVDHIDGDNENNERTNLRFLCPNCHSQTETYKFYGKSHR